MPYEIPSERPSAPKVDDVFAYVRRLVGSAEPAIVFSSLVSFCAPGFSDFCSADIVEGGRVGYRIAGPRPGAQPASGGAINSNAATRHLFEIRTSFDSVLDGWPPYTGVVVHRWRNYQPNDEDEDRAARIVGHAIRVIRDERLADPMRGEVAPAARTFQRARGLR